MSDPSKPQDARSSEPDIDVGLDDVAEGWFGSDEGVVDLEAPPSTPSAPPPEAGRPSAPSTEGAFDEAESLAEFEGVTSALDELKNAGVDLEHTPSMQEHIENMGGEDPFGDLGELERLDEALDASFSPTPQPVDQATPDQAPPMFANEAAASGPPPSMSPAPVSPADLSGPYPADVSGPYPSPAPGPQAVHPSEPPARSWPKIVLAIIIVVGLTVVGVTYLLVTDDEGSSVPPPDGPALILVEGDVQSADGTKVLRGPAGQDAAVGTPTKIPGPVADAAPATPAELTPTQRITAAFGAQRERITACFSEHAVAVQGAPEIDVQLTIGIDGGVRGVSVLPEPINDSPLGRCLARVALSTSFPPQERVTSVSIPIQARVVN